MTVPAGSPRFGYPLVTFDEIDSTNAEALRRAGAGERGPLWLFAHRQSAGYGRSRRGWKSAEGNLTATLLIEPGCAPTALPELSFVAGLAVYDAVLPHLATTAVAAAPLRLKWPNDILAGTAKLGGILIESTMTGPAAVTAIGIGINCASAPAFPDRETSSLSALGMATSPLELLSHIGSAMASRLALWARGAGFAAIRSEWLSRTLPLGEPLSVNTGRETLTGTFTGIDETGALLLGSVRHKPETIRRITHGDVSLLPPRVTEG